MNKKTIVIALVLLIGSFFIGRLSTTSTTANTGYLPPLKVVGDVEETLTLLGPEDFEMVSIENQEVDIDGIKLEDLILKSKPISNNAEIVLVGIDGLASKIKYENLEKSYIAFTEKNGWEAINLNHPISSNIKHLKEIVIVSTDEDFNIGFNVIDSEENILNTTVGRLYLDATSTLPYFEGESSIKNNGKTYSTTVYTERNLFRLKDILRDRELENPMIMCSKGAIKYIDEDGYFQIGDSQIDYIGIDGKDILENVAGAIINPTNASIMDSYYDMVHYLEEDSVLFLYIDGLGYHQYEYAIENDYLPFLSQFEKARKAMSVNTPVTNAGFAAMITGQAPDVNGVYSREQRQLNVDSIFGYCNESNKEAILIEGDIGILDTETPPPQLNMDRNSNGTTDDEVFEATLDAIKGDYDLVFAHFHGLDDSGHSNGDLASETMEVILRTDKYIEKLVSQWKGKIIITSDHGMHSTDEGGNHGNFRYEDMFVPYLIIDGGID